MIVVNIFCFCCFDSPPYSLFYRPLVEQTALTFAWANGSKQQPSNFTFWKRYWGIFSIEKIVFGGGGGSLTRSGNSSFARKHSRCLIYICEHFSDKTVAKCVCVFFVHVLREHAVDVTAEFCDDIQETIHRILVQWTDQGGRTAGQQKIVELPIEHGGLGFLPVKDLAAIARLSALASLPDIASAPGFRQVIIDKKGLDLETKYNPKWQHLQGRL